MYDELTQEASGTAPEHQGGEEDGEDDASLSPYLLLTQSLSQAVKYEVFDETPIPRTTINNPEPAGAAPTAGRAVSCTQPSSQPSAAGAASLTPGSVSTVAVAVEGYHTPDTVAALPRPPRNRRRAAYDVSTTSAAARAYCDFNVNATRSSSAGRRSEVSLPSSPHLPQGQPACPQTSSRRYASSAVPGSGVGGGSRVDGGSGVPRRCVNGHSAGGDPGASGGRAASTAVVDQQLMDCGGGGGGGHGAALLGRASSGLMVDPRITVKDVLAERLRDLLSKDNKERIRRVSEERLCKYMSGSCMAGEPMICTTYYNDNMCRCLERIAVQVCGRLS